MEARLSFCFVTFTTLLPKDVFIPNLPERRMSPIYIKHLIIMKIQMISILLPVHSLLLHNWLGSSARRQCQPKQGGRRVRCTRAPRHPT